MPRAGLTPDAVVASAATLLDAEPGEELSLTRLAATLGVKTPSLYNHVAGQEDLKRRVAMAAINQIADALRTAVMAQSGAAAIRSLAAAYRTFAEEHPGVYPLTQEARPDDAEYAAAGLRAIEPVQASLRSCGIDDDRLIHHVRAIRSALHGFVLLENQRGFGLDIDVDATFEHLVDMLVAASTGSAQ